ncbi:MAG TPA: hypothetical protein VHO72_16245 [Bacteroidales bacterium]|nr:hypothetical protein [Bacteroidales bacterium]
MSLENSEKKCIAVHLPLNLYEKLNEHKSKTGKSQSGLIIDFLEKGLNTQPQSSSGQKLIFCAKVRIDTAKMLEMGQKLQGGELDTSQIVLTYCQKDDPAVGISFWKASSMNDFEVNFARLVPFYKEVIEVSEVVTPTEAMNLILAEMKHGL